MYVAIYDALGAPPGLEDMIYARYLPESPERQQAKQDHYLANAHYRYTPDLDLLGH